MAYCMYTAKRACGKVSNIPFLQKASFHRDKSILFVLNGMHFLLQVSNTNMAEVGHSRNATRGAKNDTRARVAADHVVESAILQAKVQKLI